MNSLQNSNDSAKITASFTFHGREFKDVECVNPGDWFGKTWLLGISCGIDTDYFVVEANSASDAIDELVDSGKGDALLIDECAYDDYGIGTDNPTCSFYGNAGRPCDTEWLSIHGDESYGSNGTGFPCLYHAEGWAAPFKPTDLAAVRERMEFLASEELVDVDIPSEFLELASEWYDGMDMLYALTSTGDLTLGTLRPWNNDVDRYLTDREWHVCLWSSLESDVRHAAKSAEKSGHDDATELRRFETFCEETSAELRTEYGLEDSEAV